MDTGKLVELGFNLGQINLLIKMENEIGAYVESLNPFVSVETLRTLKNFINNHEVNKTFIKKVLIPIANANEKDYFDKITDFKDVKLNKVLFEAYTSGADLSKLPENATAWQIESYIKHKKDGKDVSSLINRGFFPSQIDLLANYLSYDLSKFDPKMNDSDIELFAKCVGCGIDPFIYDIKPKAKLEYFLQELINGNDLSEYLDLDTTALKFIKEVNSADIDDIVEILRNGYTIPQSKVMLEFKKEGVDFSKVSHVKKLSNLKALLFLKKNDADFHVFDKILDNISNEDLYKEIASNIDKVFLINPDYVDLLINNDYTSGQVSLISFVLEKGIDPKPFMKTGFNERQIESIFSNTRILSSRKINIDYEKILHPEICDLLMDQMFELSGLGFDIDATRYIEDKQINKKINQKEIATKLKYIEEDIR